MLVIHKKKIEMDVVKRVQLKFLIGRGYCKLFDIMLFPLKFL